MNQIKFIAAIIPVYNNHNTVMQVIDDASKIFSNVIVVDDGSDIPVRPSPRIGTILIRHEKNMGKGKALQTGIAMAKDLNLSYAVSIDADGQHIPSEIFKFPLENLEPQTIYIGSRNLEVVNVPFISKFGRFFSNIWVNIETKNKLTDTQCGFRIYPICIDDLKFSRIKYDFEVEVLVAHAWAGGSIKEFQVSVIYQPTETRISHFDKLWDNVRISLLHFKLLALFVLRFTPLYNPVRYK